MAGDVPRSPGHVFYDRLQAVLIDAGFDVFAEETCKRYLIHVTGQNLGLLMRLLIGAGTPKEAAARGRAFLVIVRTETTLSIVIYDVAGLGRKGDCSILILTVTGMPT